MIASVLEVLESSFILSSNDDNKSSLKATAIDVASRLLILPTPPSVQMHTTALLAALHSTKQVYHFHKVYIKIDHPLRSLTIIYVTHLSHVIFAGSCIVIACSRILEVNERS